MRTLIERDGSDLHIKVGSPPMARIQGHLQPLDDTPALEPEDTEEALEDIIPETGVVKEFADVGEADFSYALPGASRFRVNAFRQRGTVSIAARAIPFNVRSIDDLSLPPVVRQLAEEQRGIVLLTGTTGSGKSTTLASMIDHINTNYAKHIITLEDPIEYLHQRQEVDRQPARGRRGHRELRPRDAPRPAPGPRRDPDRGDAR